MIACSPTHAASHSDAALWLPCTQMYQLQDAPPLAIVRGEGAWLYDADGKGYLDMISSWWVNLHGHCHPTINAAIKQQLDTLEHTLLASVTHPPALKLAERLVAITPAHFSKVFFADSGSAAVEVALKMSLQYWHQQGKPDKTRFISLEHGYHGETIGSLSVTDVPLFSQQYQAMITDQIRIPSPADLFCPPHLSQAEHEANCLNQLEQVLSQQAQTVCAIIVEPLVQGATGMAMYSPNYLVGLAKLARDYQVQVIYDEIAVGFGRTGTMFAVEQMLSLAGDVTLAPDFLCLSKGLTAGYLPMSCVLTHDAVYNAFYDERVERGFLHSHSFTGNPLACAAALASLEVFEQNQVLANNQQLSDCLQQGLSQLIEADLPICHARQTGMIAAFTLATPKVVGKQLARYCLEQGVLIRPIGNHVYLIPPYCTTPEEIAQVFKVLAEAISQVVGVTIKQNKANFNEVADFEHHLP